MASIPKDIWIGTVMLAVAILYWFEADKIRISPLDGPVGASGLPKTLAWALGLLAVLLILRSVAGILLRRPAKAAESGAHEKEPSGFMPHLRAIGMLAIGVAYLLVIPFLGYTISVGLLLGAVALYVGAPAGLRTLIVAVVGAAIFYLLFVRFLGIPLPPGSLYSMLFGTGG